MCKTPRSKKTVYILGAGFSSPAGGPDQSSLVEAIFRLPGTNAKTSKAKEALKNFLVDTMHFDWSKKAGIALEDVYTPIDRCLADGVSLRGKAIEEIRELRSQVDYLISLAIDKSFDDKAIYSPESAYYVNEFAEYLVDLAACRSARAKAPKENADDAKAYDPFSVISLNWDILLDSAIYRTLGRKDEDMNGDYDPIGVVDYCCYISSIEAHERRIRPGLWALGARGYNVKLLKIHGSMNWLQCSNCQRLFVGFDGKVSIPNFINAELCRHCVSYGVNATLQSALVMPTFLKDLTNFQLKVIWQNAAVELMEADKLVFIGYSLPQADFEFRQLLSRSVRKDAEIEVVLYHDGTPEKRQKFDDECLRYRQFFGNREVLTKAGGVQQFIDELMISAGRRVF